MFGILVLGSLLGWFSLLVTSGLFSYPVDFDFAGYALSYAVFRESVRGLV